MTEETTVTPPPSKRRNRSQNGDEKVEEKQENQQEQPATPLMEVPEGLDMQAMTAIDVLFAGSRKAPGEAEFHENCMRAAKYLQEHIVELTKKANRNRAGRRAGK